MTVSIVHTYKRLWGRFTKYLTIVVQ